jgi:23S rRNA (guanine745-N1)-methyltransferase
MLDDVVSFLECPQCQAGLQRDGAVLRCGRGHAFDIARQGYVSLLPPGGRAAAGDTAAMVAARAGFLDRGHYASLAGELARLAAVAAADVPGCVADVGAGPGYYLAAVLDGLPGRAGLAVDASRFAARRAARAHPRIGAVTADAWRRLPVAGGSAAVILNVFAPRSGPELHRVLSPAGRLLVVTPAPEHLRELTGPLGLLAVDPRKDERLTATFAASFELQERHEHAARLRLDHDGVAAVAGMGPTAWHAGPAALAGRIARLPAAVPVTMAVTISVYRPARAE